MIDATPHALHEALDDIDRLDAEIIRLWHVRAELTAQLVKLRADDGAPGYCHAEQLRVIGRYRHELGAEGVQVAQLLLRHALH